MLRPFLGDEMRKIWYFPINLGFLQVFQLIGTWKWVYKGLGVWENLFWHPFDDSRGLQDHNATGGGLRRPLEVGPQPLLVIISHLISFILPWNEYIRVWGHGKTYSGIHLMIQEVCMTPMPQEGVCGDPWRSAHSLFWSSYHTLYHLYYFEMRK